MKLTCLELALALATAQPATTLTLAPKQDCPAVAIRTVYPKRVTINGGGSTIRGLTIAGGNVRLRSLRFVAPLGAQGAGPNGYAAQIRDGARNVRFDSATFTDARMGLAIGKAAFVTVADSRFTGLRSDGIHAGGTAGLVIVRNRFTDSRPNPTQCALEGGVVPGLSSRDCIARGGTWKDGDHPDAVQMRNGVSDALLEGNSVEGRTQGLAQMDTTGDAPLLRVTIRGNTVSSDGPHKITLGACIDCLITGNTLKRAPGSTWKAVIIGGAARVCGNVAEFGAGPPC